MRKREDTKVSPHVRSGQIIQSYEHSKLEKNAPTVIGLLALGVPGIKISEQFDATSGAVSLFKSRHKAEIDAVRSEYVMQQLVANAANGPVALWIKEKEARIAKLQEWIDRYSNPLVLAELMGDNPGTLAGLLNTFRALLKDAANELGDLPSQQVNVDARTVTFTLDLGHATKGESNEDAV